MTWGLHGALVAAEGARIVSLSSSGSLFAPVLFGDPRFRFIPYTPFVAYGQSKTACTLLAVAADRRWASQGIRVQTRSIPARLPPTCRNTPEG